MNRLSSRPPWPRPGLRFSPWLATLRPPMPIADAVTAVSGRDTGRHVGRWDTAGWSLGGCKCLRHRTSPGRHPGQRHPQLFRQARRRNRPCRVGRASRSQCPRHLHAQPGRGPTHAGPAGTVASSTSSPTWPSARSSKNCSAYSATQAAVLSLTRSLAVEWGRSEIRVNAVGSGWSTAEDIPLETQREELLVRYTPMRRKGHPP